ncbi:MAG: multiheme c-type cytochrome, partial [Terriglobia bacterium]
GWGMSPGYERQRSPDFYRPVTPECLVCHVGRVRSVPQTLNAYKDPPLDPISISCERCHGPAPDHPRDPTPGSIVNPAKLPQRARDSVCEQCHLSGEARIPNPGKRLSDFQAGENLENVYTVYVFKSSMDPAHPNALTVISQSQQLALSQCARQSHGKLWCGTCHDPHHVPVHPVAYYRARCLSCHGDALLKAHPKPDANCIRCHMPRLPTSNGGHTIFTDHRIAIYTPREISSLRAASSVGGSEPESANDPLVPWHDPPPEFAERNLGLAYARVGNRLHSLTMIRRSYQLLFAAWPQFPKDPALLRALAQIASGAKDGSDAQALLAKAATIEPRSAPVYYEMAQAAEVAHDNPAAIRYLEKSLQLDPMLVAPYEDLARIYIAENRFDLAHATYEHFLKAFPENLQAKAGVLETGR